MELLRDIRLAARSLRRSPAFTATAVLSLACGLFVVATTFAVLNAYVVRDMPYPAARRLVRVSYAPTGEREPRDIARIDWSALADVVEWADVSTFTRLQLVEGNENRDAMGLLVPRDAFEPMGARLSQGRVFSAEEYLPGAEPVVIASTTLTRGSALSPDRALYIALTRANSGEAPTRYRVIGVLQPNFRLARGQARGEIEFILPQRTPSAAYTLRLRPDVPLAVAERRVTDAVRQTSTGIPAGWAGVQLGFIQTEYVSRIRPILSALIVAGAAVLLIVAANIAVLVVLRALRREREVAVRLALGAGPGAIMRMFGAESAIACGAATVVGLAASALTLRALGPSIESRLGLPVPGGAHMLSVDGVVILVAIGAAVAVAALLSVAPLALRVAKRLELALRSGGRGGSDGPAVRSARFLLVSLQVAASLTLLFGGGLVARTVHNLTSVDLGYDAAQLVRVRIRFPERQFPDTASIGRYQQRLEATVLARTGSPVAFSTVFPFYEKQQQRIEVPGVGDVRAAVNAVGTHYFDVVGMETRSGRVFNASDGVASERVAVVSETLARLLWPGREAVGQRIRTGANVNSGDEPVVWRTVVGVVSDVRETHRDADYKDVFVPSSQLGIRFAAIMGTPGARVREWHETMRTIAMELDPNVDVGPPVSLADNARQELAAPRFLRTVLAAIAVLAIGIALVGIYGVTAYAVEQRRREVAVRSALGAPARALVGLFLSEGVRVVGLGVLAGSVGAMGLGRVLSNQVFGVSSADLATLVVAATIVIAGALLAAWLPARRVAGVDAAALLRTD